MNPLDGDPLEYFNRWLVQPIAPASGRSVLSILDALDRHPLARDDRAQDYVMPPARYREKAGRFRIFGENQDTWFCFVDDGAECQLDPPVYCVVGAEAVCVPDWGAAFLNAGSRRRFLERFSPAVAREWA